MADEKRVVRTAAVYGNFVLPGLLETDDGPADLVISPEGTEVDFATWRKIADAAEANQVVVRLDEDFPGELYAAAIEEHQKSKAAAAEGSAPVVDGTDANAQTGSRRGAKNGG